MMKDEQGSVDFWQKWSSCDMLHSPGTLHPAANSLVPKTNLKVRNDGDHPEVSA